MSFKLVLASQSPRRKEILLRLGLNFTTHFPHYDESLFSWSHDYPEDVMKLAHLKAHSIQNQFDPQSYILAADTIVVFQEKIYGKPKSFQEAKNFLMTLGGKTHEVFSGLCLCHNGHIKSSYARTSVKMREMSEEQIQHYMQNISPLDKAAGYAIQGGGALAIEGIEGCYYNVMGLPIFALHQLFQCFDIDLFYSLPKMVEIA